MSSLIQIGRTNFSYCSGCRVGSSEDRVHSFSSLLLVLLSLVLFDIFCARGVVEIISLAAVLVLQVMAIITISLAIIANQVNPGIIPNSEVLIYLQKHRLIDDHLIQLHLKGKNSDSFCQTCNIFRKERTVHCKVCNVCVEMLDHHCPFLSNCIGKRNYQYFILFLISLVIYISLYLSLFLVFLLQLVVNLQQGTRIIIASCFGVFLGLLLLLIFMFLVVHCYMLITGKTTRDLLKGTRWTSRSSYDWMQISNLIVDFREKPKQQTESIAELKYKE